MLKVCNINYGHISCTLIGWFSFWIICIITRFQFSFICFLLILIIRTYKRGGKFGRIRTFVKTDHVGWSWSMIEFSQTFYCLHQVTHIQFVTNLCLIDRLQLKDTAWRDSNQNDRDAAKQAMHGWFFFQERRLILIIKAFPFLGSPLKNLPNDKCEPNRVKNDVNTKDWPTVASEQMLTVVTRRKRAYKTAFTALSAVTLFIFHPLPEFAFLFLFIYCNFLIMLITF